MEQSKKNTNRKFVLVLALLVVVLGALFFAVMHFHLIDAIKYRDYTRVSSVEELMAMSAVPDGKYILTEDIDLTGVEWKPFAFSGVLEGQGHTIDHLTVMQTGDDLRDTYDGNLVSYETSFAGFFTALDQAEVRNVHFENAVVDVQTDVPCFAAVIAGYMDHSVVENCVVKGTVTLHAHDRMFGVAGVVGFGNGDIDRVHAEVTLICTDTDRATKDEQFLGGIVAAGYPNMTNCEVVIDGYVSEHGYTHNGGMLGMYQFYPTEQQPIEGVVSNNYVEGRISFFEENDDRRAYCDAIIGERMQELKEWSHNLVDFERNEVYDYDAELLPEK